MKDLVSKRRQNAERRGRFSEWLAAAFLQLRGYSILARRYKCPAGEIDLVARRGKTIVFAEVKARADLDSAVFAVTRRTQRRIGAAAASFLARHRGLANCGVRYDILAVAGFRIRHIPNAWRNGE
jgi:putative endonuclease